MIARRLPSVIGVIVVPVVIRAGSRAWDDGWVVAGQPENHLAFVGIPTVRNKQEIVVNRA